MLHDAEFWVLLGFLAFLGLILSVGAHKKLAKSLDDRAARIKAELDEARKLREEAAQLLADYQRKRQEAEGEAQGIIAGAKAEAERMAAEAKAKVEEFVERRTKMAETKIAQAEAQAAAEVRGAAADAAVAAAGKILGHEAKGKLRRRAGRQGHRGRAQAAELAAPRRSIAARKAGAAPPARRTCPRNYKLPRCTTCDATRRGLAYR